MKEDANAAGRSMRLPQQDTEDVPTEKSGVYDAENALNDSEQHTSADAEFECQVCRVQRERAGLGPRALYAVPQEVTNAVFKQQNVPLLLCGDCDGQALERALNHLKV